MSASRDARVGCEDVVGSPRKSETESAAAALHELSERLTAATNYIASSLRLSELGNTEPVEHGDRLGKALTQLERAGAILNSLRKLLQEDAP